MEIGKKLAQAQGLFFRDTLLFPPSPPGLRRGNMIEFKGSVIMKYFAEEWRQMAGACQYLIYRGEKSWGNGGGGGGAKEKFFILSKEARCLFLAYPVAFPDIFSTQIALFIF